MATNSRNIVTFPRNDVTKRPNIAFFAEPGRTHDTARNLLFVQASTFNADSRTTMPALSLPATARLMIDVSSLLDLFLPLSLLACLLGLLLIYRQRNQYRNSLRENANAFSMLQANFKLEGGRLQYLFENTADSVYCYQFDPPIPTSIATSEQVRRSLDGKLVRYNASFAGIFEAEKVHSLIGSCYGDRDSSKNIDIHDQFFTAFINNGYRLDAYELDFIDAKGKPAAVIVNMLGILNNGMLDSVWAIESNVVNLRDARAELERRQRFQSLVATVSSKLIAASDADSNTVVEECMRLSCEFIDAGRAVLFWANDDQSTIHASNVWSEKSNDLARDLPVASIPEIAKHILANQVLRVDDVAALPKKFHKDRRLLAQFGVRSCAVMPLIDADKVVGGMTFGRIREQRDWTEQDIRDLSVLSELFANYVLRQKSRQALAQALSGLQHATERLEAENVYLRDEIKLNNHFDTIVGDSYAIRRCLQLVEQVADTTTPVLLLGETGTGKELVARAIHDLSSRRDRALVKVNCAALPANLIESELFGHEKGAFTGANSAKRGRFDLAAGSTLFLDEFGEIPLELQAKLLRVLQEGEFERLGGGNTVTVDVRIIVATNRDLSAAVIAKEFRSDLYYRVNTFPIELPALRNRGDDVELLARHFVALHATRLNREVRELSSEMMRQIRRYHWPGNVRELEGIIQRALIATSGPVLTLAEPLLPQQTKDEMPTIVSSTIDGLKLVERDEILSALDRTRWRISGDFGAATLLGVPPSTLRSKMKRLGIVKPK